MFLKFLLFFAFLSQASCQNGAPVQVNTTRGLVQGYHFDQGNDTTQLWYGQGDIFLGIPFALPPIEELRYKVNSLPLNKKYQNIVSSTSSSIFWTKSMECHILSSGMCPTYI